MIDTNHNSFEELREADPDRGLVDVLNKKIQDLRLMIFRPFLKILTKLKISANDVTNFRLLLGLFSVYVLFYLYSFYWAGILMVLALMLDIVDGALARYQGTASDRGKFLDIFVDGAVYSFIIFLLFKFPVNYFYLGYNLFVMPIVYLLATIKKEEFNKDTDWIIKPYPRLSYLKALIVVPFFIYIFLDLNYLNFFLLFSNILSTVLAIYYYIFIQWRWRKKYG